MYIEVKDMAGGFAEAFTEGFGVLINVFEDNPYALILLLSMIGNSIPYASVPYYLVLLVYAYQARDPLELVALALVSGVGATVGKLVIYGIGRGVSRVVPERDRRNVELFGRLIKRWGFLFVLAVTSTPIPDDVILIPIAFAGYSISLYFIATLIGKTIVSLLIVFFGRGLTQIVESAGVPLYIQLPLLLAISVTIMILILRIDWAGVVREYESKGIQGALNEIYRNIAIVIRGKRGS